MLVLCRYVVAVLVHESLCALVFASVVAVVDFGPCLGGNPVDFLG